MFGKLKNIRRFALFNAKNNLIIIVVSAFFYAVYSDIANYNIGYQIPADCCTTTTVIVLGGTGGDSLSYFYLLNIFSFAMPRTMKEDLQSNNSTLQNSSVSRNEIPQDPKVFSTIREFFTYCNASEYQYTVKMLTQVFLRHSKKNGIHKTDRNSIVFQINHLMQFALEMNECLELHDLLNKLKNS